MLKKTIALTLIFALLAPTSSALATASETNAMSEPSSPSLEEILNEYHSKSFYAQSTGISLCSGEKSLEEETVETLNNAGYEAYYVTGDNYNELEELLQTDFSAMGLNNESFYIVTLDCDSSSYDYAGGTSRSSSFYYTYNGVQYLMRRITITSSDNKAEMVVNRIDSINDDTLFCNLMTNTLETLLVAGIDKLTVVPLATIALLTGGAYSTNSKIDLDTDKLVFNTSSAWTCNIIQIYDGNAKCWRTAQYSEYVSSRARASGSIYNEATCDFDDYYGQLYSITTYSDYYKDSETRKKLAASAYESGRFYPDYITSIKFYLGETRGSVVYTGDANLICEHSVCYTVPRSSSD